MKNITIITWFIVASALHAEQRCAVKAGSGRFEVAQEYQGDRNQGDGGFLEVVRFQNRGYPEVRLSGLPWPGIYSISPNEQWLLRTQKTGSGNSMAILYRIEGNGRVSEVVGFDDLIWGISDTTSRLKKKELDHTGVSEFAWSEDNGTLEIVLRGRNASQGGDGIECHTVYDLKTHQAVVKEANSKQDGGGHSPALPESKSGGDKPHPEAEDRSR